MGTVRYDSRNLGTAYGSSDLSERGSAGGPGSDAAVCARRGPDGARPWSMVSNHTGGGKVTRPAARLRHVGAAGKEQRGVLDVDTTRGSRPPWINLAAADVARAQFRGAVAGATRPFVAARRDDTLAGSHLPKLIGWACCFSLAGEPRTTDRSRRRNCSPRPAVSASSTEATARATGRGPVVPPFPDRGTTGRSEYILAGGSWRGGLLGHERPPRTRRPVQRA